MKNLIPIFDPGFQNRPIKDELLKAFGGLIDSGQFVLGKTVADFEKAVCRYSGARHAIGVSSGTDALLVSMIALGIGPGDAVVTPVFTFLPTAGSATRLGATPFFVDVEEESGTIDPQKLTDFLRKNRSRRKKIKAVLPVHLFGQCAAMKPIMQTCRRYGIPVIEDAAQAIGAQYPLFKKSAGTIGTMGCLSFYPTKNLGGVGDGGMILTDSARLAKLAAMIRNHGLSRRYYHRMVGGNFRLDAMQAAALTIKLRFLKKFDRMRLENARLYRQEFIKSGLLDDGIVTLPAARFNPELRPSNRTHLFNQHNIMVPRRNELRKQLLSHGIQTEIYYPLPLHMQPCYRSLGYGKTDFPVAEKITRRTLALPVYPGLKPAQIKRVVKAITAFYKR